MPSEVGLAENWSREGSCSVDRLRGNTVPVDKARVAANFSKAAATYDDAATLQKRVSARAMLGMPSDLEPERVLDLGSGTGSQTSILSSFYPEAHITGMDMAMGMLQHAKGQQLESQKEPSWCSGDIESLPFRTDSFDLVFSSLAIQWCSLETVLEEVSRVLKPGGMFVFSSLASGTMSELNQAWSCVDKNIHVNGFSHCDAQKQTIINSPLTSLSFRQQTETLYYSSVSQLLRELKALGVNTVHSRQQGLMTRRRLTGLQQAYEEFRTEDGLPLSYQVLYGVLKN